VPGLCLSNFIFVRRDNEGSIGKDFVPLLEAFIGGHNERTAFIAAVHNLIEQIGGIVVIGQVSNLINNAELNIYR
jgi:hypothetical protein